MLPTMMRKGEGGAPKKSKKVAAKGPKKDISLQQMLASADLFRIQRAPGEWKLEEEEIDSFMDSIVDVSGSVSSVTSSVSPADGTDSSSALAPPREEQKVPDLFQGAPKDFEKAIISVRIDGLRVALLIDTSADPPLTQFRAAHGGGRGGQPTTVLQLDVTTVAVRARMGVQGSIMIHAGIGDVRVVHGVEVGSVETGVLLSIAGHTDRISDEELGGALPLISSTVGVSPLKSKQQAQDPRRSSVDGYYESTAPRSTGDRPVGGGLAKVGEMEEVTDLDESESPSSRAVSAIVVAGSADSSLDSVQADVLGVRVLLAHSLRSVWERFFDDSFAEALPMPALTAIAEMAQAEIKRVTELEGKPPWVKLFFILSGVQDGLRGLLGGMGGAPRIRATVGGVSLGLEGAPRGDQPPELVQVSVPPLAFMTAPKMEGDRTNSIAIRLLADVKLSYAEETRLAPDFLLEAAAASQSLQSIHEGSMAVPARSAPQVATEPTQGQLLPSSAMARAVSTTAGGAGGTSLDTLMAQLTVISGSLAASTDAIARAQSTKAGSSHDLETISRRLEAIEPSSAAGSSSTVHAEVLELKSLINDLRRDLRVSKRRSRVWAGLWSCCMPSSADVFTSDVDDEAMHARLIRRSTIESQSPSKVEV